MTALPSPRGLFQQRYPGDAALLRLARLRFAQAGMPAELYADSGDDLDRLLGYLPEHPVLPTVHLNRRLNLLSPGDLSAIIGFGQRFAGRVAGFVVHDQADHRGREGELLAALAGYSRAADAGAGTAAGGPAAGRLPWLFLEYAAGHDLGWYDELIERAAGLDRVSCCVDIGHVGRHAAGRVLGADWMGGDRPIPAPEQVIETSGAGVAAVCELVASVGRHAKTVHFHLHDAHPLAPGLPDHFSFLTRYPVAEALGDPPRRSVPGMFGPVGLARVLRAAAEHCGAGGVSLTLEIHQSEGRLPLDDEAAALFAHWADLDSAERLNHWLSVISANFMVAEALATGALLPAASAAGAPLPAAARG